MSASSVPNTRAKVMDRPNKAAQCNVLCATREEVCYFQDVKKLTLLPCWAVCSVSVAMTNPTNQAVKILCKV